MSSKNSVTVSKYNVDFLLNVIKIAVIILVGTYLIGNYSPYQNWDAPYLYAVTAKNLSHGVFSISNELLQSTGDESFLSGNYLLTIHNTAIPRSGYGFSSIATLFYLVGGEYGLYYLSPIFAILLLIFVDRFATCFFGKYVGLLSLLFLATDHLLFRNSLRLQTEAAFTLFFLIGCFFLLKFLKNNKEWHLFTASSFLVFSTFIRINGAIFFPIEIIIVLGYFILKSRSDSRYKVVNSKDQSLIKKIPRKKTLRLSLYLIVPWIVFILFWTSFYDYYFGDPFTNYRFVNPGSFDYDSQRESTVNSLIQLQYHDLENIKQYSKYLLPYQFVATYNNADDKFDETLGAHWPGIISIIILISVGIFSIKNKLMRTEIFVFLLFIAGTVWFFSSITTPERASYGIPGRYMFPAFTLSYVIYGFLIVKILQNDKFTKLKNMNKIFKYILILILILFFILAFYFSPPIDSLRSGEFQIKNPNIDINKYPQDVSNFAENTVLLATQPDRAVDYNLIPFKLTPAERMSEKSIELLKKIIADEYLVVIMKESTYSGEKNYLLNLIENHGLLLKDYSENFCQVKLAIQENRINESNPICLLEE